MRVYLVAPVFPTEDPERVRQAILNLFPDAKLEARETRIQGEAVDVSVFRKAIARARISDTARHVLLGAKDGAATTVRLSKQAAFVSRLNFATVPGPLSDIDARFEHESEEALLAFVDAVAPDTRSRSFRDALSEKELALLLKSERGDPVAEWDE